jgi:hypothetical protein
VSNKHGRRLVRLKDAPARLGVGRTTFRVKYINTGRVRLVPVGKRGQAIEEEQLDALVDKTIAEGEASAPIDRSLQVRDSASGRFVKASTRKSTKEIPA